MKDDTIFEIRQDPNIEYFQDHMPGNNCFGCGRENHDGLKISSYWEGDESVCIWRSQERYQGWKGILHGGILASIIDCHTMCTAMAAVYKLEGRNLDSEPIYRYATGTLTVKYLRPTPNDLPIELRARVKQIKGKKVVIQCRAYSEGELTAEADVIAIRVFDSSKDNEGVFAADER
ncbi:MAG: acyl-coenzyme A thioesterase PaaI-like protein [Saprospiraceae bacterium]|jgi:acyl-coenzyme A thioesterase PaaI-like protein